jgi:uncharacterized membrane-anchored protein YhcB (DUF1043 family)
MLKRFLRLLRNVRWWQILILFLITLIISILALRSNNEQMNLLRNNVYSADKNNTDVQQALNKLQAYVTSHMNTSLNSGSNTIYPPIQLVYTYQRLLNQEATISSASNSVIYTDAEYYCQQKIPTGFSGIYRVPCIEQYISSHNLATPNIPQSLYEFDFLSPSWSPDFAGWSLLGTVLIGLLLIIKLLFLAWNKYFN